MSARAARVAVAIGRRRQWLVLEDYGMVQAYRCIGADSSHARREREMWARRTANAECLL